MAKKSRRPAPPPPAARFSPAVRLVSALTALMMVGSLIFVVVVGGRGGDNTPAPVTVPAPKDCPAVDKSDGPRLSFSSRPTWCLDGGTTYTAVFDTTEGEIRVVLDRERTPETVNNFVVLTRYGYYDDTLLFRFDPSIAIIQGGAPKTNDWSDPGPGYTIPDEGGQFLPISNGGLIGPFTYQPGDLVMARSAGPNSSGAQFFFATGPEVGLLDAQGTYIVFGHADVAGQAVLEAMMGLYRVDETSPYGGGPSRDVVVRSVTIEVG